MNQPVDTPFHLADAKHSIGRAIIYLAAMADHSASGTYRTVADDADLEEVYNTERHLLYVACTRARDHLLVSGVNPASEFLEDLAG